MFYQLLLGPLDIFKLSGMFNICQFGLNVIFIVFKEDLSL